jgi:hypothetical protein
VKGPAPFVTIGDITWAQEPRIVSDCHERGRPLRDTRRQAARAIGLTAVAWLLAVTLQAGRALETPATPSPDAPPRLVDTGLYAEGRIDAVDPRNRPFAPQYPLWSDGLEKRRWVFLPPGAVIDATNEHEWDLPIGTKFWKEFRHGGRKVETRFLWRASATEWVFATYAWNEAGTDAVLADVAGVPGVVSLGSGRGHDLPSRTDCQACHGTDQPSPLGFTALQLSPARDPGAIHAEPLAAGMITLSNLVAEQRLAGARRDLLADAPRIRTDDAQTRSLLGYLAANCGACHNGRGEIAALGPTIRVSDLVEDGDAVARGLIGQRTKWQVPGVPDGESVLVHPGAPERSAIAVRMMSRRPSSQMPPLGTVVRDQEAVDLVTRWIGAAPTRPQRAPTNAGRPRGAGR